MGWTRPDHNNNNNRQQRACNCKLATVTGNWQRAVGNCNWQHARLELKQIFVQSQRRQLKMAEMGDDNGQCIKTLHQTVGNLLAWEKTKEQREGGGVGWQFGKWRWPEVAGHKT